MITVLAMRMDTKLTKEEQEQCELQVSRERFERARRMRSPKAARQCLLSELFVQYAVTFYGGMEREKIQFAHTPLGKPYIKDAPVHFNISHAGDWMLCAISSEEVGIDIEKIGKTDYQIARRMFHPDEYQEMKPYSILERRKVFYEYWTMKESYVKYTGTGLSVPLNSFCVNRKERRVSGETVVFDILELDNEYKTSVCRNRNQEQVVQLERVELHDMLLNLEE